MQQIGRNYYCPNDPLNIPQHKYVSSSWVVFIVLKFYLKNVVLFMLCEKIRYIVCI